jgi:predicted TIM-barrel enzyme
MVRLAALPDGRQCPVPGSPVLARHFLKHPIDHAHMEVHMLIEAGTEAVDGA